MSFLKKYFFVGIFLFVEGFLFGQTTFVIQPGSVEGKDAFVISTNSDDNFGYPQEIIASGWTKDGSPKTVRSFIEFDLSIIPDDAVLLSAKLSLYGYDSPSNGTHSTTSGSNEAVLQRILTTWEENTVTWNNQPIGTNEDNVSLGASITLTQDYLDINVDRIVQRWLDNPVDNHGFLLKLITEEFYRRLVFGSSDNEDPNLRPKLEIIILDPEFEQTCDGDYDVDLSQNLLLHYSLDNNAIDDSGNGFDGTMVDILSAQDRNGGTNGAVDFEIGSKIILPENSALQPDYPFSISFWSFVKNPNIPNVFFASDYVENDLRGAWAFQVPDGRLSIGVGNGKGYCGPSNRQSRVSVDRLKSNQWNHIVTKFVGPNDFQIYINGCKSDVTSSGSGSWDITYSDNPGVLGEFDTGTANNSGNYHLKGSLDDFYFWDRAITEEEVLYLYDKFQVPKIILQNEFTYNGEDSVFIGANPIMTDVKWSNGDIGNIGIFSVPGIYTVEGYYNCILVCDSILIKQEVIVNSCDTILPKPIACSHDAYECVLSQANGGYKYYYEGHIRVPDGYELCENTISNASFNHGAIDIVGHESHVHSDDIEWIAYSAYLYIDEISVFQQEDSYISFDFCAIEGGDMDYCVSYLLPFKQCYTDYTCQVEDGGATANSSEIVDFNYCLDLHEVVQDKCNVSAFEIEVVIYGADLSKTVYNQILEGDFSNTRCIKIPISVDDFLSQDYNCVELFITGDCPGISCAHLDCNIFYSPAYFGMEEYGDINAYQIVGMIESKKEQLPISLGVLEPMDFEVYPNPTNGNVNIHLELLNRKKEYVLNVKNVLGKLCFRKDINEISNYIDLSMLESGVYYITVEEEGRVLNTKKIIKL